MGPGSCFLSRRTEPPRTLEGKSPTVTQNKLQLNSFSSQTIFQSTDLSTTDDGLETRAAKPVHSESGHWNGNAAPQTHMTGNVCRIR